MEKNKTATLTLTVKPLPAQKSYQEPKYRVRSELHTIKKQH